MTFTVPPLVAVENDVFELVTVADVELVLRTVCEVVVKVESVVSVVEVLVDSICVDVAVNVPVGELVVVTVVETVPVTRGVSVVEATTTGGAVVVVLVVVLKEVRMVVVWSRVWVEETVVVVGVTVNVALAMSPVVPVTVTLYVPLASEATVKEPDTTPPDTEHVGLEISPPGDEYIEQPVSPAAKFDPETVTLAPAVHIMP